jgi:hypothetical protein
LPLHRLTLHGRTLHRLHLPIGRHRDRLAGGGIDHGGRGRIVGIVDALRLLCGELCLLRGILGLRCMAPSSGTGTPRA